MSEQGLNEDTIRRRDDEANIDRVYCTYATEKATVGKHFPKEKCGDRVPDELGNTVNTLTTKKQCNNFDVLEKPIPLQHNQSNHSSSTRAPHRGTRIFGITNRGVMIYGSVRRALIGKSTNSDK